MTLEGQKFSTSRNWAVWVPDILSRYQPDSLRYFLIANGPEKRDTDFSWREFIHSHNSELLGAFGNFVNRTLAFINKAFDGRVPQGEANPLWSDTINKSYSKAGKLIEAGRFKDALEDIFATVRQANKSFDEQKPWATLRENPAACSHTLYNSVQIIANLANLLNPFIPFSCGRIRSFLSLEQPCWHSISVPAGQTLQDLTLLFERIDLQRIEEETERLQAQITGAG